MKSPLTKIILSGAVLLALVVIAGQALPDSRAEAQTPAASGPGATSGDPSLVAPAISRAPVGAP
ncbi:MAG: hypothetical protein WBQ21_07680, partial [Solirubrobacteraceae bacterium]